MWNITLVLIGVMAAQSHATINFYLHNSVPDPESRAERIMLEGFSIRGYEPFPLDPPVDWAADPHDDTNWRYQLNAMYPLGPIFQGLAERERPAWRQFARRVFLDWIEFNITENHSNPFKWNDMATGIRASYLAQLIAGERYAADIPPVDMEKLVAAGRMHVAELSEPERFAGYNHGIFQMVGIAALCEVHRYAECEEAMPYARARYRELFDSQFNEEGMHLEHSPAYHLLGLNVFQRIERAGLLELPVDSLERLEIAQTNLQWMIHPDGGFVQFGDTEARSAAGSQHHDAAARWLRSNGRSGETPSYGVKAFPKVGYAFARLNQQPGDSYLALTVAHHSRIHKHDDAFSFEWSDQGRRILVDSGKWGYDDAPERKYVTSARAHNVVTLEGHSYSGRPPEALPTVAVEKEGNLAILGASGRHSPGRFYDPAQERWLLLNPGEWLVVRDEVSSYWPREAVQWFQLPPEAEVEQVADGFNVRFPWTDSMLRVFSLTPVEGLESRRGEQREEWAGWYSSKYRELLPSWQIGFRSTRWFAHQFATTFRWIAPQKPVPELSETMSDIDSFCWTEGDRRVGARVRHQEGAWVVRPCA